MQCCVWNESRLSVSCKSVAKMTPQLTTAVPHRSLADVLARAVFVWIFQTAAGADGSTAGDAGFGLAPKQRNPFSAR